ncbi:aspartate--tRNA ligase [Buchnera aphidicola]|uniref:Aspartate--tRNA ligase n=1 Tax=Buchnera aphidicola (Anoecia oenotherae) TaxID=1241833 RepID=A0A4D6Y4M8_9GAMM|nr:aspartate--tRNA ligase [Buchnera aphidicola]QCI19375.1 aspartate--tRNA ligase [Buchnera aphidicola (Anoecia oenotherae)]
MRTKYCGDLCLTDIDTSVILCGWVDKIRNFGSFLFLDLRDNRGIVQIFIDKKNKNLYKEFSILKNEYCIKVHGIVKKRLDKNINLNLNTGKVEVLAKKIYLFNKSQSFPLDYNHTHSEETRFLFRYLDLRNKKNINIFKIRSKIVFILHYFLQRNKFINVETPILTKVMTEGSRNYLVASRIHIDKFYALSQSPQIYKQLLMISGFDRYYQITKCFRDEDLRSDRQPEFTQLDVEMSFMDIKKVRLIMEKMIRNLWKKVLKIRLDKFPVITFNSAIEKYGSDKPDLRNPLLLINLTFLLKKNKKFRLFFNIKEVKNYKIVGLCVSHEKYFSRKRIEKYNLLVAKFTKSQLIYIQIINIKLGLNGIKSSHKNLLDIVILQKIINETKAKNGDIVFLMIEQCALVSSIFGILRKQIGEELNLIDKKDWKPVWIIDFPLFNKDVENNLVPTHHPFTSFKNTKKNLELLDSCPEKVISEAYDLVINGYEAGGGSVRINSAYIQDKIFNLIGMSRKIKKEQFGFFLKALDFGTPPHAGMAFGLDRIIMLMTKSKNIKDVIAFPKTTSSYCLTTGAPNKII